VVINTVGWVDGAGYDLLLQQADAFDADVIVVIGDDRLHSRPSVDPGCEGQQSRPRARGRDGQTT
ncbi:MAG: Clp1/GlmU family protein, partial [Promethearchaeia archaeon]